MYILTLLYTIVQGSRPAFLTPHTSLSGKRALIFSFFYEPTYKIETENERMGEDKKRTTSERFFITSSSMVDLDCTD